LKEKNYNLAGAFVDLTDKLHYKVRRREEREKATPFS